MSLKVNGKNYDWGDVDVKLPGLDLVVQEVSYDDEQDMEESYGYGHRPGATAPATIRRLESSRCSGMTMRSF